MGWTQVGQLNGKHACQRCWMETRNVLMSLLRISNFISTHMNNVVFHCGAIGKRALKRMKHAARGMKVYPHTEFSPQDQRATGLSGHKVCWHVKSHDQPVLSLGGGRGHWWLIQSPFFIILWTNKRNQFISDLNPVFLQFTITADNLFFKLSVWKDRLMSSRCPERLFFLPPAGPEAAERLFQGTVWTLTWGTRLTACLSYLTIQTTMDRLHNSTHPYVLKWSGSKWKVSPGVYIITNAPQAAAQLHQRSLDKYEAPSMAFVGRFTGSRLCFLSK